MGRLAATRMPGMEVTFTKGPGRRYFMTVVRERGIALAARQGPGYHDWLPHDAVHFIVEREAELAGGVFGRIATGQSNIFSAADPQRQRADMERSEMLASLCLPLWEYQAGHRSQMPPWVARFDSGVWRSPLLDRILPALDEFAARWHALPSRGGITLTWELPASASRLSSRSRASRRVRPARTHARPAR